MSKLYRLVEQSEKAFMAQIVEYATMFRWHVYHTFDSRHSVAGFPDLVLLQGSTVLVVELKTMRGKLSPGQREWLMRWYRTGKAEVYVWNPSCWLQIGQVLAPEGVKVFG